MAFKRISLDDKKKGLGADAFFKNTKDFLVDEDNKDNTKKDSPIKIMDLDKNNTSNSENIIKDNAIINPDVNITDNSTINDNNTITDNIDFDDIINVTDNDKNDASNDDVIKNIRKVIKKRVKYTDIHERRTYYLDKDVVKKLDKLSNKYGLDKSYLVNEALKLFFNVLENKNKS